MPGEDIVLANPFKTRIIAEAQIKTDKVDARILADLLRGHLISRVHVCGRATLGAQDDVELPHCSDLFGAKGMSFLNQLELPAPAGFLLRQQLALLRELAVRIHRG